MKIKFLKLKNKVLLLCLMALSIFLSCEKEALTEEGFTEEALTEEELSVLDDFGESSYYADSTPADTGILGAEHDLTSIDTSKNNTFITEEDEDGNHYLLKDVNGKTTRERISRNFPWGRGHLVAVGYQGNNLSGNKYFFWSKAGANSVVRFAFPFAMARKMESIAMKDHCSVQLYRTQFFEGVVHKWLGENTKQRWSNSPNKRSLSMTVRCRNTRDAGAIVYENRNYGGRTAPLWDIGGVVSLPNPLKGRISSVRVNTRDFRKGIQMGDNNDVTKMMAFESRSILPADVNDKIARIVLGRNYGRRCNPKSTCWTGDRCNGSILQRVNPNPLSINYDKVPDTPRKCATATARRGIPKNKASFCSRNGFCYNPRLAQGVQ